MNANNQPAHLGSVRVRVLDLGVAISGWATDRGIEGWLPAVLDGALIRAQSVGVKEFPIDLSQLKGGNAPFWSCLTAWMARRPKPCRLLLIIGPDCEGLG